LPDVGTSGVVQRGHVPADGGRGHRLLPQGDELPDASPDLRFARAFLPGVAVTAVRVRDGVPLREVRRGARADPRPGNDPGRLAHLLHPGAVGRRITVAARVRVEPATRLRTRRFLPGALHA